jgi:hypothetical protein
MITKFKLFLEALSSDDYKNILDLDIEKKDAAQKNDIKNDSDINKNANLKITEIKNKIDQIEKQKEEINKELLKLQDFQRDMAPNDPNDPKNSDKLKSFLSEQKNKIEIQKSKLKIFDDEINSLKIDMDKIKKTYL